MITNIVVSCEFKMPEEDSNEEVEEVASSEESVKKQKERS